MFLVGGGGTIFRDCRQRGTPLKYGVSVNEELGYSVPLLQKPHQWQSDSAFKAGRQEMPGSNPGRICRLSRSEFSMVFSETLVNTS